MSKKRYRVKVTEKHVGFVWVEAENKNEALALAMEDVETSFDCIYDAEITQEKDMEQS